MPLLYMDMRLLTCLCLLVYACLSGKHCKTKNRRQSSAIFCLKCLKKHRVKVKAHSTKCNAICPWEALHHTSWILYELVSFSQFCENRCKNHRMRWLTPWPWMSLIWIITMITPWDLLCPPFQIYWERESLATQSFSHYLQFKGIIKYWW